MNKELQNRAWSVLPKEFKEEVKKEHRYLTSAESIALLLRLFGYDNLTSDAEGEEEEMLTVSRKEVQEIYAQCEEMEMDDSPNTPADVIEAAGAKMELLDYLFGSKCLPDANEDNFTTKEPKEVEPKNLDKEAEICPSDCLSHHADPCGPRGANFGDIQRLNIATQFCAAILSNPALTNLMTAPGQIVELAIKSTDIFLDEYEKGVTE